MGESDARLLNELHNAMREVYRIVPKRAWRVWNPEYCEIINLKDCFYRCKDTKIIAPDLEKILSEILSLGYYAMTHYDDECENFIKYCDTYLGTSKWS